ncbi:DNA-binding protein, partial [Bacteroidales bacterium OttesenSCG-928-J19]|nr:DNA-binding protein [Bacteroidales bacterium OttesenSCG-928-J19]
MNDEIMTRRNKKILNLFKRLDLLMEKIETMSKNNRHALNGEIYLTDKEVSEILKISRRTLQEYR